MKDLTDHRIQNRSENVRQFEALRNKSKAVIVDYDNDDEQEGDDDFIDGFYDKKLPKQGSCIDGVGKAKALPRSILYDHIRLRYVRPRRGDDSVLVMEVKIAHTKGEYRKPQPLVIRPPDGLHSGILLLTCDSKIFTLTPHENLLLCPVSFMLALALHDKAFEAPSMSRIRNILSAKVPERKNSLRLRWRDELLSLPMFRHPEKGWTRTSNVAPLRDNVVYKTLVALGERVGFEDNLTQYSVRRETGNAVDGRCHRFPPAFSRIQVSSPRGCT